MYFQSYGTIVVKVTKEGDVFLDRNCWNCSKATSKYRYRNKYRNRFLSTTTKETKKRIKSGKYRLADLNHQMKISAMIYT